MKIGIVGGGGRMGQMLIRQPGVFEWHKYDIPHAVLPVPTFD